jgi:hypothetical protein
MRVKRDTLRIAVPGKSEGRKTLPKVVQWLDLRVGMKPMQILMGTCITFNLS